MGFKRREDIKIFKLYKTNKNNKYKYFNRTNKKKIELNVDNMNFLRKIERLLYSNNFNGLLLLNLISILSFVFVGMVVSGRKIINANRNIDINK